MKRFLLFKGEEYYPRCGWDDFRSDFDTLEQAAEAAIANPDEQWEWAQIVDSAKREIVKQFEKWWDYDSDKWVIEGADDTV